MRQGAGLVQWLLKLVQAAYDYSQAHTRAGDGMSVGVSGLPRASPAERLERGVTLRRDVGFWLGDAVAFEGVLGARGILDPAMLKCGGVVVQQKGCKDEEAFDGSAVCCCTGDAPARPRV